MLSEFKTFIARGNVLDLAVGVIIGAGFGKIVSSLTDDVIMPVIAAVVGDTDFSAKYIVLSNFLILAFVIFMIVRQANKIMPPPAAAPAGPSEVDLLTEIRDSLKK
jgi:large conductance mechanosensitive channel